MLIGEQELVVDRLRKYFSGLYPGGNDGESSLAGEGWLRGQCEETGVEEKLY